MWCRRRRGGRAGRRRHDGVGGRQRLLFELLQPQLAPGGRSPGSKLAFLFLKLLDGAKRGTVAGTDLGGSLGGRLLCGRLACSRLA
jgi:hypothetical protein